MSTKLDYAADAMAIAHIADQPTMVIAHQMGWTQWRVRQAKGFIKNTNIDVEKLIAQNPNKIELDDKHVSLEDFAKQIDAHHVFTSMDITEWERACEEERYTFLVDEDDNEKLQSISVDPGIYWPEGTMFFKKEIYNASTSAGYIAPRPISYGVIVTAAQSHTPIHGPAYQNLAAYASIRGLEMGIGGLHTEKGAVKKEKGATVAIEDYPRLIADVILNERLEHSGVQFAFEVNTPVYAENALSSMESYCGGKTTIFPHTKQQMATLPRFRDEQQQFMWSSGVITVPNYSDARTGVKASHQHHLGAIIVEIDLDGNVFTRNIRCCPDTGEFFDLDYHVSNGVVSMAHEVIERRGLEYPIFAGGCTHKKWLSDDVAKGIWGYGGMPSDDLPLMQAMRFSQQVLHDTLDGYSISHHDRSNPYISYAKHLAGETSIEAEIKDLADFLLDISQFAALNVTYSNHDDFFPRWLKKADWKKDMVNAKMVLKANLAHLEAIDEGKLFNVFEWALREASPELEFELLTADKPKKFFSYYYNLHGDKGVNGSQGRTANFAKLGVPIAKAHDHQGTIRDDVVSLFCMIDNPTYAVGPSSWARGFGIEHCDGTMQMIPMVGEKWRP